jgi:hypothetical protein
MTTVTDDAADGAAVSEHRVSGPPSRGHRWPPERVLFALAGTMTLLSVLLAVLVSPWFLLLTAFVGVNQWLYVTAHACPASLALARCGRRSTCDW